VSITIFRALAHHPIAASNKPFDLIARWDRLIGYRGHKRLYKFNKRADSLAGESTILKAVGADPNRRSLVGEGLISPG